MAIRASYKKLEGDDYKKLGKESKEGYWVFVLKHGILYFGLPLAILMYIYKMGFKINFIYIVYFILAVGVLGGFLYGTFLYYCSKRKLKTKNEK